MSKKVMLFFGSGISFETGLPTVQQVTDRLLNGWWWRHTDGRYYAEGTPGVVSVPLVPRLQSFLKVLLSHADSYAAQRCLSTATYEDLYFLCQQIRDEESGEIDNPAMRPFIDLIRPQVEPFFKPFEPPDDTEELNLKKFADESCRFIECAVEYLLTTKNSPKGLGLVKQLAKQPNLTLDIVTLNHDTVLETMFDSAGIPYSDGFGPSEKDIAWFDPRHLDATVSSVTLLKLHGSINWHQLLGDDRSGWVKSQISSPMQIMINSHCHVVPRSWCLIGSYNKLSGYSLGIFAQLHLKFFVRLQGHSTIVMSGYGWNDHWMNLRLFEWLNSVPQNKIVLLHKHTEEVRRSRSAMCYEWDDLKKAGKLIVIEKWLSETCLQEILPHLPQ
ncbi:MAG: SIR2 family protein [Verrucomicrobia bacterium]|nr:SIR2 family protein [Verrucomicrobiota bacterium]